MTYLIDALAFGPHPDDVELFCGGTMLRLADLGYATAVVDLTRGERASGGTPEERALETEAASAILGLRARENLGLPDTGLDASSREQLLACVAALRRLRPELVLIPWVEERHPDHVAAAALLVKALVFAGVRKVETDPPTERFAPRQVFHYAMRHHMTPTLVIDTSAAQARKLQAIRCYASQVTRRPGGDPTLISAPTAVDAIDARDRWIGSMIGVSHGEALRAPNVLGVVDPLRLLRDNPFPEAHAFEPLE
jgi:bacillithiol biosynthesis deacetylase BshB1